MSENNNNTIQILIAIIISLSMVIIFSGVFYILNMQNKIEKLETKQEEQLKQQLQIPNTPAVEITQPQTNMETETQKPTEQKSSSNKANSRKNKKNATSTQREQSNVNTRDIERTIDDTINQIDRQNSNSPKNDNNSLSNEIQNILK